MNIDHMIDRAISEAITLYLAAVTTVRQSFFPVGCATYIAALMLLFVCFSVAVVSSE